MYARQKLVHIQESGKMKKKLEIYSNGILHCSVCTNIKSKSEIEKEVNLQNPTGIVSQWSIDKNNTFSDGKKNGVKCEKKSGFKHWLMVC